MKFKAKVDSWWCRLVGKINPSFMSHYWTTVGETVYYPNTVSNPNYIWYKDTVEHEQVHIEQYKKYTVPLFLFLYLLVPLPILFSYFRWKFEREAYLVQIRKGADVEDVVQALWLGYGWPWPKSWMRKWFLEHA